MKMAIVFDKRSEKDLENAISEKMNEIASFILTKSQETIVKNESIDTGALLRSGELDLSGKNVKTIKYTVPYATDIEFGTDPHPVPVAALTKWCRRKLGDEKLAWAVAMKIEREGTDPKPFLRPSINLAIATYGK